MEGRNFTTWKLKKSAHSRFVKKILNIIKLNEIRLGIHNLDILLRDKQMFLYPAQWDYLSGSRMSVSFYIQKNGISFLTFFFLKNIYAKKK